jgi:hypothetical protein
MPGASCDFFLVSLPYAEGPTFEYVRRGDVTIRLRAALPFARALERRCELDRAIGMLETLLGLNLGTPSWREQGEVRLRRLAKVRWRRRELAPAS